MKDITKLKRDWVDVLGKGCSGCLSAAGQDGSAIKVARLYGVLEETLIREQSDGNSIRRILKNKEEADDLVESLRNSSEYRDAQLDEKYVEIGATLAVAFAGIISARWDDNYQAIGWMREWCAKRFGDGHDPENYTFLLAAKYYYDLGTYRYDSISREKPKAEWPGIPSHKDFEQLLEKAERESEDADKEVADDYYKRLLLFVVASIAQLPPYLTEEIKAYDSFLDNLKQSERAEHNHFCYYLSRAAYAQNKLDEAIALAIKSLQAAPAIDLRFIAQCRQYLLTLEQEKMATETIIKRSEKEMEPKLNTLLEENKQAMRSELAEQSSEFEKQIHKSEDEARNEIKNTLLTVIEILGLFLAIAGAVVASVGGIVNSDSILQSFVIYATSGVTIVVLFWLLRAMVLKPLREKRTETPQTTKVGP